MKSRMTLFGLIAVLLLSHPVQGGDTPGWTRYTSKKGGFSVLLPGMPKEQKKMVKTPYATSVYTVVKFIDLKKWNIFMIDFVDLPQGTLQGISVEDFLDEECDVFVQSSKGKVLNQSEVTLGKVPGREVEEELLDGRALQRTRIFLVDRRLVYVMVIVPNQRDASREMTTFLDSFQLAKTK